MTNILSILKYIMQFLVLIWKRKAKKNKEKQEIKDESIVASGEKNVSKITRVFDKTKRF